MCAQLLGRIWVKIWENCVLRLVSKYNLIFNGFETGIPLGQCTGRVFQSPQK